MPVNLSIKNTPDDVVERLRKRAARNHRSLQGELLAIVEEASLSSSSRTASEVFAELKALGLETRAESVEIVRADRDAR